MKRKNIIGLHVRRYRREACLSVEDVHSRIAAQGGGLSVDELRKIERRERRVKDYEIAQIAIALGVKLEALFPGNRS